MYYTLAVVAHGPCDSLAGSNSESPADATRAGVSLTRTGIAATGTAADHDEFAATGSDLQFGTILLVVVLRPSPSPTPSRRRD